VTSVTIAGAKSTSTEHFFRGATVCPVQVSSPPMIENGAVVVTLEITAATALLLVRVTFFGLLVAVASTLPKLIAPGAALNNEFAVDIGVGVGVGVAVGAEVAVAVGVSIEDAVAVGIPVGVCDAAAEAVAVAVALAV